MRRSLSRGIVAAVCLVLASPLGAQSPDSNIVAASGSGAPTFVIISGLLGGNAGFRRLEPLLVHAGARVIRVDIYRHSVDSTDVSFAALARRVDTLLAAHKVSRARLVGHAHGGGVALRLAARSPHRVEAVYLLDVGALESNKTKVFSSSLRFVPFISFFPGGKRLIRSRLVAGLRDNSGSSAWLDSATTSAYTEPLLANLGKAVSMAGRLARAREPDSLATVLSRVTTTVLALVGGAPHPSEPDSSELSALTLLGDRARVERFPGVGHFPHEEIPADIARRLLADIEPRPTRPPPAARTDSARLPSAPSRP